ncbi:MAG: hypothetical protein Q9163_002090 [Psora crenata]
MAYIQKLSNEILKEILDHIESDPQLSVAIDRRDHLSVESFRPPSPPTPSQVHDIGSFRLSCRRFAELGIPYQFARVSLRFSRAGFRRLDDICNNLHLTRHTKKFSYLVPPFYARSLDVVNTDLSGFPSHLDRKITEQRSLLRSGDDVRVLRKAMRAFASLQHVQLLRLIEPIELGTARCYVNLEWSPACTHASKTLGDALIYGRSPFCRFSGPMMEPYTARIIQDKMLSALAFRLTCLELHFDGGPELVERMVELSGMARTVLLAAKNLQAIHIGFPSRTPLDLQLETVFHNIRWDSLRAFGIQAWRLDAREIIRLVRRHKTTLRGLRLRDVQLKKGSKWRDVLGVIRSEIDQLDWVSLRRIGYSDHFDQLWEDTMEVPDEPPFGASDSDDEEDDLSIQNLSDQQSIVGSEVGDSDEESTADTDHGPDADDIAISPDTPITLPFCTCSRSSDPATADELGDNGINVTYQQRKMWEKWVVGRCPEHA